MIWSEEESGVLEVTRCRCLDTASATFVCSFIRSGHGVLERQIGMQCSGQLVDKGKTTILMEWNGNVLFGPILSLPKRCSKAP